MITQDPHALFTSVLTLMEDCRYLAAYDVFLQIQLHFNYPHHPSQGRDSILHDQAFLSEAEVAKLISEKGYDVEKLKQLSERVKDIHDAVRYQDDKSEWTLGADMFGVKTYYKLDERDNSIIVKLEGQMDDLPIFELCSIVREVDLFHEWVPFCKESLLLNRVGKAELVSYVWVSSPIIGRDAAVHAYGADCLLEHGLIVIAGKSTYESNHRPIPFKPEGWGQCQATILELKAIVNILHPTSAQITIIFHIDPHTILPQFIINFAMRNLAGVILYLASKQAMKASQDPSNPHARRIREDTEFYRDWLLPKLRDYCDYKGWEQPVISTLGEHGIPALSR